MNHIFIVGCGHTGTTLLATLLAAHSDFHVITRETGWFTDKSQNFSLEYPLELQLAQQANKTYLVEKTPKHIHSWPDILALFPDAKFISTARNAKDVVWSLKNRSDDFASSLDRWVCDHTAVVELINCTKSHLIRYEDLISQPEIVLKNLCQFIGCVYEADMMNYYKLGISWFGVEQPTETNGKGLKNHVIRRAWQMRQPITDRRGIWKDQLTSFELNCIEQHCSDISRSLGYSGDEIWYCE